jgi:cytochrome c-type biogenesis protein CcmH/NrfG
MTLRVIQGGRAPADEPGGDRQQASNTPEATAPHPGEDLWLGLVRGALGPDERGRLEDHAAACQVCGELLGRVRQLEDEHPDVEPLDATRQAAGWNRRRGFARLQVVLAALAAAALFVGWWMSGGRHGATGSAGGTLAHKVPGTLPAPGARNLLLVTIDSLRADRVGAYGHAAARTPAFDAVAAAGTRFARAYAAAPLTLPSHASLLTGRYPPAHRSRHDGLRLKEGIPSLSSVLRARGLATAAFVSAARLDARFGLGTGFSVYDARMPPGDADRRVDRRPGEQTVTAALAWLGAQRDSPFFLWVHLFEPHAPYEARGGPEADASDEQRYDAEVAEADRQVQRLLDALGPARPATLVAIASDHGEAFGEHGEIGHGTFVYDTTLRVPLVMAGPGVPAGRVHETPVGLVDVAPTVLSLLGASPVPADGEDLSRTLGLTDAASARALYAESYAPLLDFGWSPLRCVRAGGLKYIEAPGPEIFDLAGDPAETTNLAAGFADDVARLAGELARFGSGSLTLRFGTDADAAARMGARGGLPAVAHDSGEARPDPKDRRAIAARMARLASGDVPADRLVAELHAVLREEPGNPQARRQLGTRLAAAGDCAGAEPHLRAAIASRLPSADAYVALASCLAARGDSDAARGVLLAARRVDPANPAVEVPLGTLAFEHGRIDEAIDALGSAVRADPELDDARLALARALARAGRLEAAHEQVRVLLARLPAGDPRRPVVQRLADTLR